MRPAVPSIINKNSGKTNNFTYAEIARKIQKAAEGSDLLNDQLLDIYFEGIVAFEKCRTKYDKWRVLGKMVIHVI